MAKNIALLCSLDTKGEEAAYLKQWIEDKGFKATLVDTAIGGEPSISTDISAEEVARAGGGDIHEIRASKNTGDVTPIIIKGAIIKAQELVENGLLDGIISFGGASNTIVATSVMKSLPFGIPKLMLSSTASMPAYAAEYIGTKDITMMHSVVDISGINVLTKAMLKRAAGGICGMVGASDGAVKPTSDSLLIALTTFKFAEECAQHVMDLLSEKGYDVIPFHAQGIGDMAMEELIDQGLFDGVVDLVPAGVSEQLFGGNRAAGPNRLESAGRRGIPQIVTPCGFEMLSCGPLSRRDQGDPLWNSRRLAERKFLIQDAIRVQARTSPEEMQTIARAVAEKLNKYKDKKLVKFIVPTKGFSSLSVEDGALYDPDADKTFIEELIKNLDLQIETIQVDTHINTPEFGREAVNLFDEIFQQNQLKS